MARYENITRFIPDLEAISSEAEGRRLEREFVEACYEPFVLDRDYMGTLERHGLVGAKSRRANVESMDMGAAVALLTLIHRSERGMYDPSGKTPLLRSFEDGYGLRILRRIAELDGTWVRPNIVTFYHEYEGRLPQQLVRGPVRVLRDHVSHGRALDDVAEGAGLP